MNRITEAELREIGRVTLDMPQEPRATVTQSLVMSVYRLSYLLKLWGAVAIAYVIARALLG